MNVFRCSSAVFVVLVALVGFGACGSSEQAPDAASGAGASQHEKTVAIRTFQFEPDPIVVKAGTTIVFVNEDQIDHTVTAGTREQPTPEVFDGDLPEKGSKFELTLDEPGTYHYFCEIHPGPGMTAVIEVK